MKVTALALSSAVFVFSSSADAAMETITGKVMQRWVTTAHDGRIHQLAKLRSNDGGLFVLDLGAPGGEGTIAAGETVAATGHTGQVDDRPVFVVRTIVEPIPARR